MPTGDFSSVASVDIAADMSQAELEATYGGSAIVFRPEAGFAVLGFSEEQAALTTLATDTNQDTFTTPEVSAGGHGAWSGGHGAWSGGWDAWAGGHGAWSGGHGAWSGGEPMPYTFEENLGMWDQINLPQAHQIADNLGAGVKVAVIDTGIDLDHPGFMGRLAPASEWKDFIDGDTYPQETQGSNYGHGTGVAGVVLQVAPNAVILPIRVLDGDGFGDTDDVAAAIDWAVRKGADVINLSLGATQYSGTIQSMVEYAASQKVFVVASSGNTGDRSITYPAADSNDGSGDTKYFVLGVGSVASNDKKSAFSTYGDYIEIVAPGEQLYTLAPGESIGYWSGTSFAAPVTSGSLALALGEALKPDDDRKLADMLGSSATDVSVQNPNIKLGFGRIDLMSFLRDELDLR